MEQGLAKLAEKILAKLAEKIAEAARQGVQAERMWQEKLEADLKRKQQSSQA